MTLKEKFAQLFTSQWWSDTYGALIRTAIAGFAPFLLAFSNGQLVDWRIVASQVALTVVIALATSLRGIPDPANATYWEVLGGRFLRQGSQFLIAAVGTATLFTEVKWWQILIGAGASALGTVLMSVLIVLPGKDTASSIPAVVVPVDAEIEPELEVNDPGVIFTDDEPTEEEEADAEYDEVAEGEVPVDEIVEEEAPAEAPEGDPAEVEPGSRFA